ncbi:carbohydrate ABC transporter permease [Dactylosporangium sp. CA-233914]|uniref:carbohydrate ABC transporter permease n=1 Tax=Dactylosporangium sp. CA-233914 TaxID=3239934 RepID=UPI003D920D76
MTATGNSPRSRPAEAGPTQPAAVAPPPRSVADSTTRWWARHRINLWHLLLVPLCALWVYPFVWVVSASFKSQREMLLGGLSIIPDKPTLDNFVRAWNVARFGEYTINTVTFSVAVVILVLLVSATAGYALGRGNVPGRKVIVGVLVATMFIPHGYTIIPVFELITSLGLSKGLIGAVLAQAGPTHVIQILLFMGYFAGIPQELEDAAQIDGAGFWRTFWSVMLPLSRPVLGSVTLFVFISAWNAFFVPLVFTLGDTRLRTLGVGMYSFYGQYTTDWTGLAAGAFISLIPIIIVFVCLQKTFVEGLAGAVKS